MTHEPQKKTTDAYRDGWDRIFAMPYPDGWPEEFGRSKEDSDMLRRALLRSSELIDPGSVD